MKDAERNRLWRAANPDKVKAQRERRKLRKLGLLPPVLPPTPEELEARKARNKAKAAEYNRRYRATNVDEVRARQRESWRKHYRLKHGIPLDAPPKIRKYATDEERREAKRLAKRKADARKRGTTLEEIAARAAARTAAKAERKRLAAEREAKSAESRELAAQRRAEARAAAERAKRRAIPAPPKPANQNQTTKPVVCPDPPELVALFAKASKGKDPLPYNPRHRKLSVFKLRGVAR